LEVKDIGVSDRNTLNIEVIPQKVEDIPNGVYLFGLSYSTEVDEPSRNPKSILRLEAADTSTKHLHQFTVFIENLSREDQGLLACVINMQTGTSISPNELERLRRKAHFDHFEICKEGAEVILFWRGIQRRGKKEFKLWYKEDYHVKDPNPIFIQAFFCYNRKGSIVQQMLSFL
jgi:hypothetical protein